METGVNDLSEKILTPEGDPDRMSKTRLGTNSIQSMNSYGGINAKSSFYFSSSQLIINNNQSINLKITLYCTQTNEIIAASKLFTYDSLIEQFNSQSSIGEFDDFFVVLNSIRKKSIEASQKLKR